MMVPKIEISIVPNPRCRVYRLTNDEVISNGSEVRCDIPFQLGDKRGVLLSPFGEILIPNINELGLVSELWFSVSQLQVIMKKDSDVRQLQSSWEAIDACVIEAICRLFGIEFAYCYRDARRLFGTGFFDKAHLSDEAKAKRKLRSDRERMRQARIRAEQAGLQVYGK